VVGGNKDSGVGVQQQQVHNLGRCLHITCNTYSLLGRYYAVVLPCSGRLLPCLPLVSPVLPFFSFCPCAAFAPAVSAPSGYHLAIIWLSSGYHGVASSTCHQAQAQREELIKQDVTQIMKTFYCQVRKSS
jgi:hypothetical protein